MKYDILLTEELVPSRPLNPFAIIKNVQIKGYLYDYYGQVNKTNNRVPDGVGVAIRRDGVLIEGGFKYGERLTHRIIYKDW